MPEKNDVLLEKLDALLDSLEPAKPDPKTDAIKQAEQILRDSLEGHFPQAKLDAWEIEQLTMAQDVVSSRIIPKALNEKEDAEDEEDEKEEDKTMLNKTDSDTDSPFKYASTTYDKEVPF